MNDRPRFTLLGEEQVWQGRVVSAVTVRLRAPDGHEFERDVVRHPGAVSVVPVVAEGDAVLLVRQYRAATGGELLEIPAGKRDVDGEPPEATARRELEEEIGMRAGRLEKLAEFYNSPGFTDERSYVFMGLDLDPCANSLQGPEEEHLTIETVAFDEIDSLIETGAIVDGKTIIGLLLARAHLA